MDELTTENRRQAAADAVEPTYHLKEGASDEVMQHLTAVFDELRIVQQYGLTLRQDGESEEETASRHLYGDGAGIRAGAVEGSRADG